MVLKRSVPAALAAVAVLGISMGGRAEEPTCGALITRDNLVACALRASLSLRAQDAAVDAAKGRQTAAETLLPSAPSLALSAARRTAPGMEPALNASATLSQEIEIAGQREARLRATGAAVEAEQKRRTLSQRDTAAGAWRAYFEALAAARELELAKRLEALAQRLATAVAAAAEKGLASGVEAELAEASALRALSSRLAAERSEKAARAALAAFWGRDPALAAPRVEGDLAPIAAASAVARSAAPRPSSELPAALALDAEQRALGARADELRRSRVPNITLSVFIQRDGFNETVIGGGLSLPIPLPHPVTRVNAGEIAEVSALARKAAAEAEAVRRQAGTQLTAAVADYTAREAEVAAFSDEKMARTEKSLLALAAEIEAGRLSLKDAALAQQALIEVLSARLAARRALCLASVDVARAAGLALEGGAK